MVILKLVRFSDVFAGEFYARQPIFGPALPKHEIQHREQRIPNARSRACQNFPNSDESKPGPSDAEVKRAASRLGHKLSYAEYVCGVVLPIGLRNLALC